jgi:putative redox protein
VPIDEEREYAVWTAEWKGGMASDVTGRGHTVRVDEPEEFGGGDTGPMPTEMVVVALASCFCIAVAWAAKKLRIPLDDLKVRVQPHRVVGEPRHGSYDLWVDSSTPDDVLAPAVDLAKRYCWVTNTLQTPPEIRYHLGGEVG